MTTKIDFTAAEDLLKELAPPVVLLGLLDEIVLNFSEVRQRARDASEDLWLEIDRLCTELPQIADPDRRLTSEISRIESLLNDDPALSLKARNHRVCLNAIAAPLGMPRHFVELMWQQDLKAVLERNGLIDSIVTAMKQDDARMPGSFTADAYQLFDFVVAELADVDGIQDMFDLATARAARKQIRQHTDRLKRVITKQDPRWPVLTWMLVKVMGMPINTVAGWRHLSYETIRNEIRRANRMLRVTTKPGRPRKDKLLPVEEWQLMRFDKDENG